MDGGGLWDPLRFGGAGVLATSILAVAPLQTTSQQAPTNSAWLNEHVRDHDVLGRAITYAGGIEAPRNLKVLQFNTSGTYDTSRRHLLAWAVPVRRFQASTRDTARRVTRESEALIQCG